MEFLARARKVTLAHNRQFNVPNPQEQIAHIHSEVSEIYQEYHHKDRAGHDLEEMCDVILATLALAHLVDYSDESIAEQMELTLQKVERRAGLRGA